MTTRYSRRNFVGDLAVSLAVVPAVHALGNASSNDRIRLGLIGCGGRGRQLIDVFLQFSEVDIPVVCDVNEPRMDEAARMVAQQRDGTRCDRVVEKVANARYWRDGKPGNEVDGPWQQLFLDCVRNGRTPEIDLEESHRATACCHLANIAYRADSSFEWDGQRETILRNPNAATLLDPPRREGYELPLGP